VSAQAAELASWSQTLELRVAKQLSEIQRISRLKQFLPSQVAELIISSGNERLLESHRAAITVVSCDLRGFTAFAEIAEPEELMGLLREYHSTLGAVIERHEGAVERFAGDGLLVLFNDPLPCPDPSVRAVRMAVEMRDEMAELNVKWRKHGHELGFGIGIAHGYATLGCIGFVGRSQYSVTGTVANLACRLCDMARSGQILVDSKVYTSVETLAEAELMGELVLKGFHQPVNAFNVLKVTL
jgi:adenylate cyclase